MKDRIRETDKAQYETLEPSRQVLVIGFMVVGAWYLVWRASTLNADAALFSYAIYGAELVSFIMAGLHFMGCWRLTVRKAPPAPGGRSVDVFIPTYNESVDLVRKTLLAAVRMDYPHKTWLLDDGNRLEMAALCKELGCGYIARTDNLHAKAGNLNNALARTSGEFVAIFDADHAPHRTFLTKTLGYFLNARVAFVQTPQDFYNLNSYQHRWRADKTTVWTEQSLFFRVLQRGKDAWNAAFFCGSCAIARRSALEQIGGFATGTVTEDLHTSIRLHAAGFESVYHAESLAFGVAPESIRPFISQRIRWGQGAMHVWRREGLLTNRGLSLVQRLNYFASVSTYFEGWTKMLFYFAPVIVLTTGTLPLVCDMKDFLLHFLPYYVLSFWAFEEVGRGYGRSLFIEQYNMIRFAAFAWSTLALFAPVHRFKVTPKGMRESKTGGFTAPHWIVMGSNLVAVIVGLGLYLFTDRIPFEVLVANTIWSFINGGLAILVLRFTMDSMTNRRDSYRFQIPLFGRLEMEDGTRLIGTVDDISDKGLRFHAPVPTSLAIGTRFQGEIELPDGPLKFCGDVRALVPHGPGSSENKGLGCAIITTPAERNRLEYFLFGSDLQWQLHGLRDQVGTPMSALFRKAVAQPGKPAMSMKKWEAAQLQSAQAHGFELPVSGVIHLSGEAEEGFLLSFSPLAPHHNWQIKVYSNERNAQLFAALELSHTIEVTSGDMYAYRIKPVLASSRTASSVLHNHTDVTKQAAAQAG